MSLVLYNSLSREKQEFKPLQPPFVKMYVCGPTVYNYLHVGNFRGPVVFNLLRNWLEESGYQVTFALNFTDVDDKIIHRAQEEGITPLEVSEKYIQAYKDDFHSLGLKTHELNPKVTEHLTDIVDMVQLLVERKKAYVADRDVLYSIESFPEYGKLSGRNVDDLKAGARVEVDEKKKNPMDFALWKGAKSGEVSWSSPWGDGRPGWHIECSAMVKKIFGDQIDIHGGGMDLIFPHHENEIAQTEGCTDKNFVNYWVHVNMLNFSGQKMSKSLGNIVSLRDFLKNHSAEIYKFMILSAHYRTVSEFGEDALQRSLSGLARIYSCLALCESLISEFVKTEAFSKIQFVGFDLEKLFPSINLSKLSRESLTENQTKLNSRRLELFSLFEKLELNWKTKLNDFFKRAEAALNDDLNTPLLMAVFFDLVREVNGSFKRGQKIGEKQFWILVSATFFVQYFGSQMSLFLECPQQFLRSLDLKMLEAKQITAEQVEQIVAERSAARASKDFSRSDELRAQLTALGISVSDTPQGSFWEVEK